MVGRPSGFTEPENPAPPSVTADGAPVSTGVGDPGVGDAAEVKVAVTASCRAFISSPGRCRFPEQPPPLQPVNVEPDAGVAVSVTGLPAA